MIQNLELADENLKIAILGNSLAVQWLGLWASTAGGTGSIPGQGTNMPHAMRHSQKKKRKKKAIITMVKNIKEDFLGGAVVKNPPASAGDMGSSPGPGRFRMPWSN